MSVINTVKVGGGGGGGESGAAAVKTPFAHIHQVTSGVSTFKEWTFTEPNYVTSIEILAFDANGQIDTTPTIDKRLNNLKLNGVEMWQNTLLQNNEVFHISKLFDEPIGLTKLYLAAARLDTLSYGIRIVARGYTLA